MLRCAGFLIFLLFWWLLAATGVVSPILVPTPQAVASEAWTLTSNRQLLIDLAPTCIRTMLGFSIGSCCGFFTGVAIGRSKPLRMLLEGVIDFARSVPVVVVIPLFVLAFSSQETSKIIGIAWAAFPIMTINTLYGVSSLSQSRREWCKLSGINGFRLFLLCEFWEMLPAAFAGMRTAFTASLVTSVVSEMFFGSKLGLGRLIFDSSQMFETPTMYVGIILVGVIGYVVNAFFLAIESRLRDWN